jgi:hypothetical protein
LTGWEFSEYVAARGTALERFAYVLTGDAHLARTSSRPRCSRLPAVAVGGQGRAPGRVRAAHRHPSYLDWRRRRSSGEQPVGVLPDRPQPDVAEGVAERDRLRRALGTLSPKQRAVLVLRHYEGLDDAAIAALLRCGEVSVRSHASRGLARLRASLGPDDLAGRVAMTDVERLLTAELENLGAGAPARPDLAGSVRRRRRRQAAVLASALAGAGAGRRRRGRRHPAAVAGGAVGEHPDHAAAAADRLPDAAPGTLPVWARAGLQQPEPGIPMVYSKPRADAGHPVRARR